MTYGEGKILYVCIYIMIFIFVTGVFIGFYFPKSTVKTETVKSEEWFVKEAGEIFTIAINQFTESGLSEDELAVLDTKIKTYNTESKKLKMWTYRCPSCFSFEYLGLKEKEDNEK